MPGRDLKLILTYASTYPHIAEAICYLLRKAANLIRHENKIKERDCTMPLFVADSRKHGRHEDITPTAAKAGQHRPGSKK